MAERTRQSAHRVAERTFKRDPLLVAATAIPAPLIASPCYYGRGQEGILQPPKEQGWSLADSFLGALAIVAACGAAYGVAQVTATPWIIFLAFAVTMALLLAAIVNSQTRRQARHEAEYAEWLRARLGDPRQRRD